MIRRTWFAYSRGDGDRPGPGHPARKHLRTRRWVEGTPWRMTGRVEPAELDQLLDEDETT